MSTGAAGFSTAPDSPGFFPLNLHPLLQAQRDEVVEPTVEHGLRVADFVVGPKILDP